MNDQTFAREWLRKNAPERVVRAVAGPTPRPARRVLDPEAVTIYSVAIFQVHREELGDGVCRCATCLKVRRRLEQTKAVA
jgi:hypothetical protein